MYILFVQFEKQHVKSNFNKDNGKIEMEFFRGGKTNIAYNCLDRHVKDGRGDQPCFLWEGNELDQSRTMTYKEVLVEVSRLVSHFATTVGRQSPTSGAAVKYCGPLNSTMDVNFQSELTSASHQSLDCLPQNICELRNISLSGFCPCWDGPVIMTQLLERQQGKQCVF